MMLFFDFDGTLIDSRKRLYCVFQELIPESDLTFQEYWELKRSQIDHKTIIAKYFSSHKFDDFEQQWMNKIEKKEYLDLDVPHVGVDDFLNKLSKTTKQLYLVTARQFSPMAQYQLNKFGWHSLFKAVLITEQKYDKALLIKPYLRNEKTYMIGDTGKDIQVGKKLDLITVGVANGFLSKESLAKYKPDYIFDSVIELTNLLYD